MHLCNYVSLSFHFSSSCGGRGAEARPQGVKPDEGEEGGGQRGVIRVIGFGGLGFQRRVIRVIGFGVWGQGLQGLGFGQLGVAVFGVQCLGVDGVEVWV